MMISQKVLFPLPWQPPVRRVDPTYREKGRVYEGL